MMHLFWKLYPMAMHDPLMNWYLWLMNARTIIRTDANPAQSLYEAWTAVVLEWFHMYHKDLYDACFRQSVTDRKTGELTDYYYWSDGFGEI